MAAVQEPEVQFAQRLASNEKPIRTRAMKKLRKYISVRSQRDTGGFTGDELLKLWKGLFYCLWMQDKPLLQEELSNQISSLLHNFQTADGQFLYLESFLQTFKREWTGIDRLRMDKFFQLVRFMFRQTFEMLKRKNWDSSLVGRFLELLTAQLLHSGSEAPSGLQFHVLDLYMTELAAVGSQELTADQNLSFIEPFCKSAAKTKDGILFRAICNSIFSTIIDQAPFAIDDLMKELKAAEASDSDSGQASEEEEEEDDEEEQLKEKTVRKPASKKRTGKQINGKTSDDDEDEDDFDDDDEDEDDDELLHLEDSDTEAPGDEDVGPVLQFDYAALADRLFALASRSNTPSQNRQRLYKIIKVLRDLSEGVFPQDEYPEEVSTDEDDDAFGSRKRMKRRGRRTEEDEEGTPASKKKKKKEAAALDKQDEDSAKDDGEPADLTENTENQKKKRKKKKKKKKAEQGGGEGGENAEEEQVVIKETEVSQTHSSVSSVKVTQAATPEGQPETLLVCEVKKQPSVTVTEETSQPETSQTPAEVSSDAADAAVAGKKKKKKKRQGQAGGEGGEITETSEQTQSSVSSVKVTEAEDPPITEETSQPTPEEPSEQVEPAGEQQTTAEVSADSDAAVSGKKKKKKKGQKLQTDVAESQVSAEAEPIKSEEPTPAADVTTPAKKKKGLNVEETEAESQVNGVNTDAGVPSAEDGPTSGLETQTDSATPAKKKSKKKNLKTGEAAKVEVEADIPSAGEDVAMTPLTKKTKKKDKQEDPTLEAPPAADESSATPLKKKKRKNNVKESVEEDGAAADAVEPSVAMTTPTKKKKKKPAAAKTGEIKDQGDGEVVSSSGKKKKRKIPIVFEYEADELEAAASINGLAEEEETAVKKTKLDGGEPSTPLSTKKSQKKAKTPSGSTSDFITFQSNAAVPTPLFCKTKGGLSTPLSGKKKNQTPKSESKKVTFGLKNNKTAEFRKTDRSLLVSPDGSSRVPFDPKQKPKFGVLKSPATPLSTGAKKTPKGLKKAGAGTPKSTPKRRPSAADFF